MRLFEFDNQLASTVMNNLLLMKDITGKSNGIDVISFLNTLQNQHILLTPRALERLIKESPALQNIIKGEFEATESTVLNLKDEEEPQVDTSEPSDEEQAQDDEKNSIEDKVKSMADKATKSGDKVDNMAKSAAKRRS